METIAATYWKTSSYAAITEDDALCSERRQLLLAPRASIGSALRHVEPIDAAQQEDVYEQ